MSYKPTVDGDVLNWEISNQPNGITINKYNGIISGKVDSSVSSGNGKLNITFDSTDSQFSYTVAAEMKCSNPTATIGTTLANVCSSDYEGLDNKTCILDGNTIKWKINSECLLKYISLTASTNYISFYHGIAASLDIKYFPTTDFLRCQITPSLNIFDSSTCKISGTPTEAFERKNFSIQALNSRGWGDEFIISIAVYNSLPTRFNYPDTLNFIRNVFVSYKPSHPVNSEFPSYYYPDANGLPQGIEIDLHTGEIKGAVQTTSTYDKTISVKGDGGEDATHSEEITLHIFCIYIYYI